MATKYVSALDGGQMDSALMDMATHTSEAWAVGSRNGTPVSGSDVTYHNNAKYYSDKVSTDTQRAEDAAARAEAAVPAGTAGAVFFDRAQSLTTAQQMQAKANISAGGTNPNLLDNPWFGSGEVVNQRGVTSGQTTHNAHAVDRWKMSYGNSIGTWSIGTNGLTLTAASGTYALWQEYLPESLGEYLAGKTVTCSVLWSDGTIYSGTINSLDWAQSPTVFTYGYTRIQLIQPPYYGFRITAIGGGTINVRAVKLELGSVSTLANDTPPDYETELAKCQYYFRRFTVQTSGAVFLGWAYANTGANFPNIIGGANMRAKPTATFSGSIAVRDASGTDHAVTSLGTDYDPPCVALSAVTTGLTANTVVRFRILAGAYVDLSADL